MFDWKEMDSAPRDGTIIFLRLVRNKIVRASYLDCEWQREYDPMLEGMPDNPPRDPDGVPSIQDCWLPEDDLQGDHIELGAALQWAQCVLEEEELSMQFIPVDGDPIFIQSENDVFDILNEPYLYFQDDGVKCPLGFKLGEIVFK